MPNVMGELTLDEKRERAFRRALEKIVEHAKDGQGGSTVYAFDRLTQVQKVATLVLERY